jgi:hypothetical protein
LREVLGTTESLYWNLGRHWPDIIERKLQTLSQFGNNPVVAEFINSIRTGLS